MNLVIGTRFWGVDHTKDFPRILAFIKAAKLLGQVLVAVNSDEDKIETVGMFPDIAFPVTPWGKFVQPLNAIILKAAATGANYLLLVSAEFPPTRERVDVLLQHMNSDTLVVGAVFADHEFQAGNHSVVGTGTTVPWNTFALWNLSYLGALGVPLIGDAPFNQKMAGVEEVCTISLYQNLWHYLMAKLIRVPDLGDEWNTDGWSEERLAKHHAKIQSKKDRPAAQLKQVGLPAPTIMHIG